MSYYKKKYGLKENDYVNASKYGRLNISLPVHPYLKKMDIKRIGFLPTLSDNLHNMGAKVNCIIENEATKIPNAADPAWKVSV